MIFSHPHMLWFLLPALIVAIVTYTSMRRTRRPRPIAVTLTRLVCLATLCLALARPLARWPGPGPATVVILDISPSISDQDISAFPVKVRQIRRDLGPNTDFHLIAVSSAVEWIEDPSELDAEHMAALRQRITTPRTTPDSPTGATALADAMRLAGAIIGSSRPGSIVLFSDGLQTDGDALGQAKLLASRGIATRALPCSPKPTGTCQVEDLNMPSSGAAGQTIPIAVSLRAAAPQQLKVRVLGETGAVTESDTLSVARGTQQVSLAVPLQQPGLNRFEVQLLPDGSATPIDRATATTWAAAPARVLVLSGSPTDRTGATLDRLLGPSATISSIGVDEFTEQRLRETDLLVLSNTAADQLTSAQQNQIRDAVVAGLGLLVTGGPISFGPGGWADSELAKVLPIHMPQELERQDPSATAVFIIDTSGSMTGPRISIAKEVVRLALRRLQPQDKAGIVEFYGSKRWAAPIQSAANHLDLNRALNRLTAGGGTVILPAIEEAEFAIKNVNTRTRHVIILTDGGVESGPFEARARRMADAGVTVSTVLVGPGQHSPFLASIAQWGRGRFYHAPDRFNLPEIILHQPQTSSPPPFVEGPTRIAPVRSDNELVRDLDFSAAPPLRGYVRTQSKPTAEVLLRTAGGDTILAEWRYGRGRVATLATDIGSTWAGDFHQWPKAAALWSNLCRSLYSSPPGGNLSLQTVVRPAGLEIRIAAMNAEPADLTAPALVELEQLSGGTPHRTIDADPARPGAWNVLESGLAPGDYRITARLPTRDRTATAAVTVPRRREMRSDEPDVGLLKQIEALSTGQALPGQARANVAPRYVDVWPALVVVSLVCLLLNVYVRRRPRLSPAASATVQSAPALAVAAAAFWMLLAPCAAAATPATTQTAEQAMDVGDIEAAATALARDAATRPTDVQLLSAQAAVEEMRGNDAGAAEALKRMIAAGPDPARRARLVARLLALLLDSEQNAAAADLVKIETAAQTPREYQLEPAVVAALHAQHDLVIQLTGDAAPRNNAFDLLLLGTSHLRTNAPAKAQDCFARALPLVNQARDRRFVIERQIAAARQAGNLPQLCQQWLADPSLPADHQLPLLRILRELSQYDEILAVWKRSPGPTVQLDAVNSQRYLSELIAAMREAGRLRDAEVVCRSALSADAGNERWIVALCRILVEQDRDDDVDTLLRDVSTNTESPARIMRIAELARDLGRDEVAAEIASRAESHGAAAQVAALLFKAQVHAHRGQRAESASNLRQATELAGSDPKLLVAVAEAVERSGDRADAIALYRKAAGAGEDVLQRLAWLLEQDGKLAEARRIWEQLWRSAGSPARRREAQNRLLDLSSRTGTIADLAAELEDRLSAGNATGDDLGLLIDIYVGARDPASAAEILNTFKNLAGNEQQALDQLAKLYLRCGRFGQADRVLRQLLSVAPDRAVSTLEEIAVLAIERNRPADAQAALEQIATLTGSAASTAELRAGVYEQLGMYAEAAHEYRAALVANPDQVEDWVLWAGAMKAANQKDRAVNRLLILAGEADSDDLFAVAVDGLLNLEAPRSVLRVARRYAIARVAQDSRKLIHYQLIRDLSEAMGDIPMALRTGEISLLVAGEQRTEMIRELITLCKSAGRAQQGIELGRTLLALGDQVPPQVFLEIGKQLLQEGRFIEADSAFARADEVSDDDAIRTEVAKLYESAGQLRLALGVLGPLLRLHPNDIELRCRAAGMHEQLGEHPEAFYDYLIAMDLMLRRGTTGGAVAATSPAEPGRTTRAVPRQGASMTEADQFIDGLVQGLIVCARDEQSRQKLLATVMSAATAELAASDAGDSVPLACAQKAAVLRRFAFALHQPHAADEFDAAVCRRYPKDRPFAASAVAARIEWGLLDSGAWLAAAVGEPAPAQCQLQDAISTIRSGGPFTIEQLDPDMVAQLLPPLILEGQVERARELLRSAERRLPKKPATLPMLLTAALALDDPASAEAWAGIWLTRAETRKDGRPDIVDTTDCVVTAWPSLGSDARRTLLGRVSQRLAQAAEADRPALALLCLRMAVDLDESPESRRRFALAAAGPPPIAPAALPELVQSVAPADAPAVLTKAVEATPATRRRALLLQLLGDSDAPIEGPLLSTFVELFAASPAGTDASRREQAAIGNWCRNPAQVNAIREVTSLLLKDDQADQGMKLALATALATTGDQADADKMASELLRSLASGSVRARIDVRTMADTVGVLSPAAAQELLDTEPALQPKPDRPLPAAPLLLRAMLFEQLGDRNQATQSYAQAFQQSPADMDVRRLFTDRLEAQLRWADIVDAFAPFQGDDTVVNQPQRFRIQKALRELGRFDEAAAIMLREEGPLKHLQRLQMAAQAGRTQDLLRLFRAFHVDNRWERRSFTPYLIATGGAGGLGEFLGRQGGIATSRQSIYRLVAPLPWAEDELSAMLAASVPDASEVATLAAALSAGCSDASPRDRAIDRLMRLARDGALTSQDRELITALARDGHALPAELSAQASQMLSLRAASDASAPLKLARLWQSAGDTSRLKAAELWCLAADAVLSRSVAGRARRTASLLDADTLRPLDRADRRLVEAASPGPSGAVNDTDEADRLARLAEFDPAAAEQVLTRFRERGLITASSHPRLAMLSARLAGQRADLPEFRARAERAMEGGPSRLSGARAFDVRQVLPANSNPDTLLACVQVLGEVLHQRGENRPREADVAVRSIALLGYCCAERGLLPQATKCLEDASRLAPHPGEPQLWISDLARRLGKDDLSDQIELALLKQRALPVERISPLLARVEKNEGMSAAQSLARAAAVYCGPQVLDTRYAPATAPSR